MSNFIILHGAWHNSLLYLKLKSILEDLGHQVICPDLPLIGENANIDYYIGYISNIIDNIKEKPIIVGQSMAGLILSSLTEKIPNKIKANVYLSAFLLENGESINEFVKNSQRGKLIISLTDNREIIDVEENSLRDACFNKCSEEDYNFALNNMCKQNFAIFNHKLSIGKNYNKVPRFYIRCIYDQTIPFLSQNHMIDRDSSIKIYDLEADHFASLSNPSDLAIILNSINIA